MLNFLIYVQGGAKKPYEVKVYWEEPKNLVAIRCSCPGNRKGNHMCKHIANVLVGVVENDVDGINVVDGFEHIEQLKELSQGSTLLEEALKYNSKGSPQRNTGLDTMKQVYEHYKDEFEKMGWYVEYVKPSKPEYKEELNIYDSFKNGNRKRKPKYSLTYKKRIADFDPETGKESLTYRESKRPWFYKGTSYKHIGLPLRNFLEDVQEK